MKGIEAGLDLLFNLATISIIIVSVIAYIKIKLGQKERVCSKEHLSLRPVNFSKKEDIKWPYKNSKAAA